MSRRRRAGNPVSLFPFVAVMASTMGALILLLLVTSRQAGRARDAAWARQQTEAQARRSLPKLPPLPGLQPLPKLAPLPPLIIPPLVSKPLPPLPPITDQRSALLARREEIKREMESLKAKRERVPKAGEERLIPLMREAALAKNRLQQMLADRQAAAKDLAERTQQLQTQTNEWEKARQQVNNRFAVVPYVGPNGTKRRPIYLDCLPGAVILQPENLRIELAQFDPLDGNNPLLRMVRAVAEVWATDTPAELPYPLFLVHPDGIETYYEARSALEFMQYPVGYELIPAGTKLAFPPADPRALQAARRALETRTLVRQKAGPAPGPVAFSKTRSSAIHRGGQLSPAEDEALAVMGDPSQAASSRSGKPGERNPSGVNGGSESANDTGDGGETDGNTRRVPVIGSSIADFVRMHQAGTNREPGLGSLLDPDTLDRSERVAMASSAERTPGARAAARFQNEPPKRLTSLSEKLAESVSSLDRPPAPKIGSLKQWDPSLQNLQGSPREDGISATDAPTGIWKPSTIATQESSGKTSNQDPSASTNGENASASFGQYGSPVRRGKEQPDSPDAAPPKLPSSIKQILDAAANQYAERPENREANSDLATLANSPLFRARVIPRKISVRVGRNEVRIPSRNWRWEFQSAVDADRLAQAVVQEMMTIVKTWPAPPKGAVWQPRLELELEPGTLTVAYALESALVGSEIAITRNWVSQHPTVSNLLFGEADHGAPPDR